MNRPRRLDPTTEGWEHTRNTQLTDFLRQVWPQPHMELRELPRTSQRRGSTLPLYQWQFRSPFAGFTVEDVLLVADAVSARRSPTRGGYWFSLEMEEVIREVLQYPLPQFEAERVMAELTV